MILYIYAYINVYMYVYYTYICIYIYIDRICIHIYVILCLCPFAPTYNIGLLPDMFIEYPTANAYRGFQWQKSYSTAPQNWGKLDLHNPKSWHTSPWGFRAWMWFWEVSGPANRMKNHARYVQIEHVQVPLRQTTLPETNIAPENRPSWKENHLPTINFQGLC